MDEHEFWPYHNLHGKFLLRDGSEIQGVIFRFRLEGDIIDHYYFVKTNNLLEFRDAQLIGDTPRCKSLSQVMDLADIKEAYRLEY